MSIPPIPFKVVSDPGRRSDWRRFAGRLERVEFALFLPSATSTAPAASKDVWEGSLDPSLLASGAKGVSINGVPRFFVFVPKAPPSASPVEPGKFVQDRFGNLITAVPSDVTGGPLSLAIVPPFPFGGPGDAKAGSGHGYSFDLSAWGLGIYRNLFRGPVINPLSCVESGGAAVYSDFPEQKVPCSLAPQVLKDEGEAERLLGELPGSRIKKIAFLKHRSDFNLDFHPAHPDMVIVSDRYSLLIQGGERPVFHMALHQIDRQSAVSSKALRTEALFESLKRAKSGIFAWLDGLSLLSGHQGGTDRNAEEFFVSLVSSLVHPDLEKVIDFSEEAVVRTYLEALENMEGDLLERLSPTVPIFQRLDQAKDAAVSRLLRLAVEER